MRRSYSRAERRAARWISILASRSRGIGIPRSAHRSATRESTSRIQVPSSGAGCGAPVPATGDASRVMLARRQACRISRYCRARSTNRPGVSAGSRKLRQASGRSWCTSHPSSSLWNTHVPSSFTSRIAEPVAMYRRSNSPVVIPRPLAILTVSYGVSGIRFPGHCGPQPAPVSAALLRYSSMKSVTSNRTPSAGRPSWPSIPLASRSSRNGRAIPAAPTACGVAIHGIDIRGSHREERPDGP